MYERIKSSYSCVSAWKVEAARQIDTMLSSSDVRASRYFVLFFFFFFFTAELQIGLRTHICRCYVGAGNRDKHFNVGSLLLGAGVVFSIEGGMNTYIRVGKLFPGPHLYAGLGITALWAASAALVPAMQKGDENARVAHIAMNVVNMGLFLWQVPTGLEIVGKVFQFTSWP